MATPATDVRQLPDQLLRVGRRAGYVIGATCNLVLLWIAHELLDWEWPPFLTPAFDDVLPVITVSLLATAAVYLTWAWRDPAWWKHLGQLGLNVISLVVAVRMWQVFPFDLSSGWEDVFRLGIGVGIVAVSIGIMSEALKLVRSLAAGRRRPAED